MLLRRVSNMKYLYLYVDPVRYNHRDGSAMELKHHFSSEVLLWRANAWPLLRRVTVCNGRYQFPWIYEIFKVDLPPSHIEHTRAGGGSMDID